MGLHKTSDSVFDKGASKTDTKWSCLLYLHCCLHPWPLARQEQTMAQPPMLVRQNRSLRQASSVGQNVTLWDTEYQEREEQVCETVYEKQCETRTQRLCQPTTRQECTTNYVKECSTIYKNVCVQKFRTEYEPYTESECTTEYKQDCQYEWRGHGNDKVWAPIEGTCQNVPYDECRDVEKTLAKQVAYQECNDVPEQKCVSVPKQTCVTVPDQICKTEPLTECQDVPRQQCHSEHKRFPVRISRQAPKKVCYEVHSTAPLAAAAVHQAPGHHQASPLVQDLLNYGVPAVPTQTVPQIIDARDKQRLQSCQGR